MYKVRVIVVEVNRLTGEDIGEVDNNLIGAFKDKYAAMIFACNASEDFDDYPHMDYPGQ